jgi:putative transposase
MPASYARHRPVHFSVADGCYFITAATLHHQPLLHSAARRGWFVECVHADADHFGAELVAWVVLPDHYHLIARVPEAATVACWMRRLHTHTALVLNREDRTSGRKVWYSYWDRCLWTEGDLWSRVNYIHRNPVKHGYVAAPEEWPHSSWPHFLDLDPQSAAAMARFPAPRQLPNDP